MKILIVGATGATGRLLVEQLLKGGHSVNVIVRAANRLPESVRNHSNVTVMEAAVLDLSDVALADYVKGCDAVACCLGHNISFKGIYGHPRRLVTDATRRLCNAIMTSQPDKLTKFVLMNTNGNRNRDLDEPISFAQHCVIWLLRLFLPPHVDNEQAAEFLRTKIGQNHETIEWVAVRPDNLVDDDEVTPYDLYPSPITSAIFDSITTSRINVGHFIAKLITNDELWHKWKGQMPVIYNRGAEEPQPKASGNRRQNSAPSHSS